MKLMTLIDEFEHFAGIYDKISEPYLKKKTIDIYDEENVNDYDGLSVTNLGYENFSLEWDDAKSTTGIQKNCDDIL